jgi:hypothetical protein
MSLSQKISTELFEPDREETAGELLFFRLFELFVIGYVIKLSWEWGTYMMRNSEVVLPLGMAHYIDVSFMFHQSVSQYMAGLITLLVIASFFRFGARWGYALAVLLFHLQYVGRFSQGEIPHSANLIGMSLLCFGIGFMFFRDQLKQQRFIFGAIIFFTGLGYTSAAFAKMIGTGINWADGNHLWLWLGEKKTDILSRHGIFSYNWLQQLALSSRPAATVILLVGWLTELSGILIWWRSLRPYVITGIIMMHIGITLSMNIRFDAFIYELILIGYPWALLIDRYIEYIPGGLTRISRK